MGCEGDDFTEAKGKSVTWGRRGGGGGDELERRGLYIADLQTGRQTAGRP